MTRQYTNEQVWVMAMAGLATRQTMDATDIARLADAILNEYCIRFIERRPTCNRCGNPIGTDACKRECIPT